MEMPKPDGAIIARRLEIADALRDIVPGEGVIVDEEALRPYESDGLTAYRTLPLIVVLPETTEQVSQVLRYCHDNSVKVVPRGAGTSLSGGALPLGGRDYPRPWQVQEDPGCGLRQPLRRGAAGRHQPGHDRGGAQGMASITRRTRPARSPAPSAAISRRTLAGCIA